jgi:hypothetical protein
MSGFELGKSLSDWLKDQGLPEDLGRKMLLHISSEDKGRLFGCG